VKLSRDGKLRASPWDDQWRGERTGRPRLTVFAYGRSRYSRLSSAFSVAQAVKA